MKLLAKYTPALWASVVVLLTVILIYRFHHGFHFETNILKLLPSQEQDPIVEMSTDRFSEQVGRKLIFLVSHTDRDQVIQATQSFATSLKRSDLFDSVQGGIDEEQGKAIMDYYFPYRYQILSSEVRNLLSKEESHKELLRRLIEILYSPVAASLGETLEDDPLILFQSWVKSNLLSQSKAIISDGIILFEKEEVTYGLVLGQLSFNPFERQGQEQILNLLEKSKKDMSKSFGASLIYTGVLPFAAKAYETASSEVSIIGGGSLLGLVMLMLFTFRSLRQPIVGFLPIGVGILCALTISSLVFESLHLITIVMGASLTGICIDYAFHYFVEHRVSDESWDSKLALKRILPGISMGMLTSILGYVGFFLTPFPGLRQIALFSVAGLIGAFATVIFWYPFLLRKKKAALPKPALYQLAHSYIALWERFKPNKLWFGFALLIAIPLFMGINRIAFDDNIRLLQNFSEENVKSDQQVRSIVGGEENGEFLLIEGKTIEQLFQTQDAVIDRLNIMVESGTIAGFRSIGSFLPSSKRQREDFKSLRNAILPHGKDVRGSLEELGFSIEAINKLFNQLEGEIKPLPPIEQWLENPASLPLRDLWIGQVGGRYASVIFLGKIHNENELIQNVKIPGVKYIDRVEEISKLLKQYREKAIQWVGIAYLFIFFLLIFRYGLRQGVLVVAAPFLATIITFAILGWLGQKLHLMHILAFLLVLGIGIDYTIFFTERKGHSESTMLAALLSAITTILSFGMLVLSSTPALRAIGLTVFLGIVFSLLLSPMAHRKEKDCRPKLL